MINLSESFLLFLFSFEMVVILVFDQKTKHIFHIPFRVEHLFAINQKLRQQLEESHRTNLSLTNDLHKLTIDWGHLRDEMAHKEDEWKEEEQVCIE